MNCREAERLLDTFFDGELEGRLMRDAALHVTRCTSCERELQQKERLHDALGATIARDVEATDLGGLWTAIEAGIAGGAPSAGAPGVEGASLRLVGGRRTGGRSVDRASRPSRRRGVVARVSAAAGMGAVAAGLAAFLLFPAEEEQLESPKRLSGAVPGAVKPVTKLAGKSGPAPGQAMQALAQAPKRELAGGEALVLAPDEEQAFAPWPPQVQAGPLKYQGHAMSFWPERASR